MSPRIKPKTVLIAFVLACAVMFSEPTSYGAPSSENVDPPVGIPVAWPSYAPDGRQIAFNTDWPGKNEILTVSTPDGRVRHVVPQLESESVTGPVRYVVSHPAWSPDGKWIAFASNKPEEAFHPHQSGLWLVRSDGLNLTRLRTRGLVVVGEPAWSPDGKQIAFTAYADIRQGGPYYASKDIWLINVDGSALHRVTNTGWLPNLEQNAHHPSFSPDGKQIVFSQGDSGGMGDECGPGHRLVIVNVDGTGIRQLIHGILGQSHWQPTWLKGGIFFGTSYCPPPLRPQFMVVQPDGTGLRTIPVPPGLKWDLTASPDGTRIAFARRVDDAHPRLGIGIYEYDFSSNTTRAAVQIKGYFVRIDIMPGTTGVISLNKTALIRVAIHAQSGFDPVAEVDKTSITFGRTGEERSLASCGQEGTSLVCHFKTALTGLRPGDTNGILRVIAHRKNYAGGTSRTRYEGRGAIQVVP